MPRGPWCGWQRLLGPVAAGKPQGRGFVGNSLPSRRWQTAGRAREPAVPARETAGQRLR